MKALQKQKPRKPRLWLGVLTTVSLVAMGLGVRFVVLRPPQTPALRPGSVTWAPSSNPANAQVVRKQDGKVLCVTPCNVTPEPGVGRVPVIFRLAGYADKELVLDEGQQFTGTVILQPEPASAPPANPPVAPTPTQSNPTAASGATPTPTGPTVSDPTTKPAPTPHVNAPATRLPQPFNKRNPTEPAGGRQVKLPTLPVSKRPENPSESMLTDDKVIIIQ